MTPAEILKELRDIHLPADAGSAHPPDFAPWPFAVLAVVVVAVLALRQFRQASWKREGRARLREIDGMSDSVSRWNAMTRLMRLVGRQAPGQRPPEAVFRAPHMVNDGDIAALRDHLRRHLK